MESGLSVLPIITWMEYFYPPVTKYVEIILPILIALLGATAILHSVMPKPGSQFAVPEVDDLTVEMSGKGRLIKIAVRFARDSIIFINAMVASRGYRVFFLIVENFAAFISYLRLAKRLKSLKQFIPLDKDK